MICPACKNDMIVVEHNKIELDYCPECQGVWFDSGELELWLESMSLEDKNQFLSNILNSPPAQSLEKKRKCPICRQKMKKVTTGKDHGALIDVCRQEDGLWLDGGEVGQVVKHLTSELPTVSQEKVLSFLGEVFKAKE